MTQKSASPPPVVVVCDNWRSCHNVGGMIRTADRFGVSRFAFIGTTPYPRLAVDSRLPHLVARQTRAIAKTALGAETKLDGRHYPTREAFLADHRPQLANWLVLEQTGDSRLLADWSGVISDDQPLWLVLGGEVDGVGEVFRQLGPAWEIPVVGPRQSLNVVVAGGIGLSQLARFWA